MVRVCRVSCPSGIAWKMLVFLFWVAKLCDLGGERPCVSECIRAQGL